MNNQEENLDLLDLEDDTEVDALPEATPFSAPRPKRPWLLMGIGIATIVLATWIIVTHVGNDSGSSATVNLDAPIVDKLDVPAAPAPDLNAPVKKAEIAPKADKPGKAVETKPVETDGNPIRVVEDRKEVTFNPEKVVSKPVAKPAAKKITAQAKKQTQAVATTNGNIYVQFGSYSTRALAQAAEQKLRSGHQNLFSGKQFVILAAEVNGKTTYRLRVPFVNVNDANGFCRNAKSDGLDCYVAK